MKNHDDDLAQLARTLGMTRGELESSLRRSIAPHDGRPSTGAVPTTPRTRNDDATPDREVTR